MTLMSLSATAQSFLESIASPREALRLTDGWRFTREDSPDFVRPDYDDRSWQSITVPHDWAIYGPFSPENDRQNVAITQDGQTEALEHAGRTGGLPFVGVGWYRYDFDLYQDPATLGDITLYIDGAMSHSEVYVNGHRAGGWPYGYNSYHLDITPYLDASKTRQVIAIRLDNPTDFSRWYPGAGLYRNVYLMVSPSKTRIDDWGTFVTTPFVSDEYAQVKVRTELKGVPADSDALTLRTTILYKGEVIDIREISGAEIFDNVLEQNLRIPQPHLWDIEQPNLYTAKSELLYNGRVIDAYRTTFGVRTIEIRPDEGFFLNGKPVTFKGVCLHHDLGPLGAAVNKVAIRRQIKQMQDMGVNAIRTSHNMPAPELIQLADQMGMLIMAESFDEWRIPKVKNGYSTLFDDWAERDLVNLIRHYRNAPSIVMWCIGNEVYEQGAEGGNKVAHYLQEIAHREDPTRPVTQGMDNPKPATANNFAAIMDVAGFNYRPWHYPEAYAKLPQRLILGTETASTLSSRGIYKFPVERKSMAIYPDHQASSYDVEHCAWSELPEDNFIRHDDFHYNIGEFIWTGIDYIGEPTPYYTNWPSHTSLFGAVDLAGIPKDRFYLYRSHWNADSPTLHILPHWDWPDRVGEVTPIFVYTSYPTAELFINGKSQGQRTKDTTITVDNSSDKDLSRLPRYRLMWMDTKYEPGEVRVVAYDKDGVPREEKRLCTSGTPYTLQLTLEEPAEVVPAGDREHLVYVRVSVVDKQGNLCATATPEVTFEVSGAGCYVASANGDATCIVPFQSKTMPAFSGQLTTIVAPSGTPGTITLTASAPGLHAATLTIPTK
ncbi:glycoside hydrolase family 2 TIM barrel-domain containing protein [Porphyromonas sp. HMSC065F10]|uniref:glycoside hydrolase family 2 TIM barrel-domain containing protein n=1 Tax=Porphyromonas sp. HMSC065F10 TaxID=1739394 RepID=UPI0008A40224|nr:beta-galactosidase [Porphyromonas sp. HMSC065F10]